MIPTHQQDRDGTAVLLAALAFAAQKHRDQRRKDPEASPYINHPIDVANILYFTGNVRDPAVLAAAVLHDTVEDTDTTHEELVAHFGTRIADVVSEVTDDKSLPSKVRKQHQIDHAPHISTAAKLVKLADKISNLSDVHTSPPASWSETRQIAYYHWAQKVVAGLRGTNAALEQAFDDICTTFFATRPHAREDRHAG